MFRVLAILAVLFALVSLPVAAQTQHVLIVKIPFEFNVLGKVMPAGEYDVTRVGAGDS